MLSLIEMKNLRKNFSFTFKNFFCNSKCFYCIFDQGLHILENVEKIVHFLDWLTLSPFLVEIKFHLNVIKIVYVWNFMVSFDKKILKFISIYINFLKSFIATTYLLPFHENPSNKKLKARLITIFINIIYASII